jgi:ABC-type branched-subunit amino acid transport system ATPase component
VTDGGVYYEGKPIHKFYPEDVARMGILQVMEGRRLAEHLTVEENLRAGGLIIPKSGASTKKDLEMVYGYFPRLVGIKDNTAGYCSGGEQQMIAGRCLMGHLKSYPRWPSGLSPLLVREIADIAKRIHVEGRSPSFWSSRMLISPWNWQNTVVIEMVGLLDGPQKLKTMKMSKNSISVTGMGQKQVIET